MKKFLAVLGLAAGVVSGIALLTTPSKASQRQPEEEPEIAGLRITTMKLSNGDKVLRLQGGYEDLLSLMDPDTLASKPPLPEDLDLEGLLSYHCGCPHFGKMSLHGENQWRYQELSRTRGPWNNTTTYLVRCQNCNGWMKATVDHDD